MNLSKKKIIFSFVLWFLISGVMLSAPKVHLTVDQVVRRIIYENFDLRKARYDILRSDSAYRKFLKKYSYSLDAELSGSYLRNPISSEDLAIGNKINTYKAAAGISKGLRTGTRLGVTVEDEYLKKNTLDFTPSGTSPFGGSGGIPEIFVTTFTGKLSLTLQQSLVKNGFGYADRITEKMLKMQGGMQRALLIDSLSGLIVQGLVDYWKLLTAKKNLKTTRVEWINRKELLAIILHKRRIGLAQEFEVNQYRLFVLQSRNRLELAKQNLFDARIKLLKNLNMDENTEIESVTQLYTGKPPVSESEALRRALRQRQDLKNALTLVQVAKYSLALAKDGKLPEVNLFSSIGAAGLDSNAVGSFRDIPTFSNPQITIGVKATYILDNYEADTAIRDATYDLRRARLDVQRIRKDIRNEISSLVNRTQILYRVYRNTQGAEYQALLYYRQVRSEVGKGRFSALQLKDALDNYIRGRYATTEALVNYNIALIQLDLAQNQIFRRFGIDPEKILRDKAWRKKERELSKPLPEEKRAP